MKGVPTCFKIVLSISFATLLVSCPVNVPPQMKVMEPMDSAEIQWKVKNKIAQAGFIRDPAVSPSGEIVSTRKKRHEIFAGDQVIVKEDPNGELTLGGQYITYRVLNPPVVDDRYPVKGYHHLLTGVIEIVDDWDGFYEGRVIASYRGVSATDLLMPIDERTTDAIPIHLAPLELTGHILGSEERTLTFTSNDLVLLDRGTRQGLQIGQVFSIFDHEEVKRTDAYVKDDLHLKIGKLIVLRTELETSTALVLDSEKELYPGILFASGFKPALAPE